MDGDLVNEDTPVNKTIAGPGNLHVWGKFSEASPFDLANKGRPRGARNLPAVDVDCWLNGNVITRFTPKPKLSIV